MSTSYGRNNLWKNLDWITVAFYLLLVILGWFSVCGASYDFAQPGFFDFDTRSGKQLVWICCSLGLGFVLLMLDDKMYEGISSYLYIAMVLVLIATIFIAEDVKGSKSWIHLGPVNVQPAEFAKFTTSLMLAKVMSNYSFNIQKWKYFAQVMLVIFVPLLTIVLQSETGSALVFFSFFIMLYREGLPGALPFSGFAAVVYFVIGIKYGNNMMIEGTTSEGIFIVMLLITVFTISMAYIYMKKEKNLKMIIYISAGVIAAGIITSVYIYPFNLSYLLLAVNVIIALYFVYRWLILRISSYILVALFCLGSIVFLYFSNYIFQSVLQDHQRVRIEVLFGMKEDLAGAGYNVNQSKIAIGSGGFAGKGFLNGTQTKLKYVPEQDTDFIFCTIGEEQGFIGSSFVLILYITFILRLIFLAERQNTVFARVYGYCVAGIFMFHVFINVGMVLGLVPVIGIPLPFFSYGGSSLWGFTMLLFIFLRLDMGRERLF